MRGALGIVPLALSQPRRLLIAPDPYYIGCTATRETVLFRGHDRGAIDLHARSIRNALALVWLAAVYLVTSGCILVRMLSHAPGCRFGTFGY